MKKIVFLCGLALSFISPPAVTSGALDSWYTDVPDHHAYYDGIFYMTQAGWVSGYEDGTFKPTNEVSRVEALKMILASTKVDSLEVSSVALNFSDTSEETWYSESLEQAMGLGIISGYPDGSFKPEGSINRAEALKMLILANDRQVPTVEEEHWYSVYLAYATLHALLTPDENEDYLPAQTLTRGELADLIYRFKQKPYTSEVEYGIASYYGYSFDGRNTASGTPLDAEGFMAAHKTLPFGTVVRITRLDTLQTVEVTIVDRGPYTEGYIIDITPAAFEQIASLPTGIVKVRLEVLNQ